MEAEQYIHLQGKLICQKSLENLDCKGYFRFQFHCQTQIYAYPYAGCLLLLWMYGHPDLFITIATNPKWVEIKDQCIQGSIPKAATKFLSEFPLKIEEAHVTFKQRESFGFHAATFIL